MAEEDEFVTIAGLRAGFKVLESTLKAEHAQRVNAEREILQKLGELAEMVRELAVEVDRA